MERLSIFDGYGRYDDMSFHHELLDAPHHELKDGLGEELAHLGMSLEEEFPIHFTSRPHPFPKNGDDGGDFWDSDPYFEEVYNEISAQECSDFMFEQDARLEQKEVEQITFEQQPLRHLRKKRYQRMS